VALASAAPVEQAPSTSAASGQQWASAAVSIPLAAGFACGISQRGASTIPIASSATTRGPVAQPAGGARRVLDVAAGRGTTVRAPGLTLPPGL